MKIINFFILTAFLFLCGCAAPQYSYEKKYILYDDGPGDAYISGLEKEYPEKFKMVHRVLLTVYGYQYDFTGYFSRDEKDSFKGVAFGDMGGKIFEISVEKDKKELLFKPDAIPEGPLLDGMVDDLRFLYVERNFDTAFVVEQSEMHKDLVSTRDWKNFNVYMFRKSSICPDEALSVKDGEIFRTVIFSDYRCFGGKLVPGRIRVHNYRWNYQFEIKLLKLVSGTKAENGFDGAKPSTDNLQTSGVDER